MDKKVCAAIGMIIVGYLVRKVFDDVTSITDSIWNFCILHSNEMKVFISAVVVLGTILIIYWLIKLFLKWQNSEIRTFKSK